jgi:dTDP-4-dehydrorhamnose reductase
MASLPIFVETPIKGLFSISLDHRPDSRGWFEEVWQQNKWAETPLANFIPVQQNASSNLKAGSTRGLHAEPWNKLVTVVSGRAFCAWVDLRDGSGFGHLYVAQLVPGKAYFVPKGVANGYQALEDRTVYTYLVDRHWSPDARYPAVNLFDPDLAIPWPLPRYELEISDKDQNNPHLHEADSFPPAQVRIIGSSGQVGSALCQVFSEAEALARNSVEDISVTNFDYVINAAAFTRVDDAEDPKNQQELFYANYELVQKLADITNESGSLLVHYSSDYVFDGSKTGEWTEEDTPRPLSRYGLSKLLGDYAASTNPRHYIVRTSWVYGRGKNFIRTMFERAISKQPVEVVMDQFGRPTSAQDLALFTKHLVETDQPYGTFNFSGSGDTTSWFGLARFVFEYVGANVKLVTAVTSEEFARTRPNLAVRPTNSTLSLEKASTTGFEPPQWQTSVGLFLNDLLSSRD